MPTLPAPGVPDRRPVHASNVAQDGRFAMVNESVSPSASVATGLKSYACPSRAAVGGAPAIVGAELPAGTTSMANGASSAVELPSVTRMTMSTCTPSAAAVGVPPRRPDDDWNDAHGGSLTMLKTSGAPSGSDATGTNA